MATAMKGDIFDNLSLSHSQAAELRLRAMVLDAILLKIKKENLNQSQLVTLLDEYQPNVSALVRGRISKISLEKLVRYADRLGIQFNLTAVPKPAFARQGMLRNATTKKTVGRKAALRYA